MSINNKKQNPKKWNDHERGERFKKRYHENKNSDKAITKRIALFMTGILITLVGLALVPLPGPGWLIVIFGMGLISGEIFLAAKLMDHMDKHIIERFLFWYNSNKILTIVIIGVIVILISVLSYAVFY